MSASDMTKRMAGWLAVGLNLLLRRRDTPHLGILLYHRISPLIPQVSVPDANVTPERFYEQLAGLKQRNFHFLSLSEAIELDSSGKAWPAKSLVVTFDDGFGNVYLEAFPVLRELEIPATVFLNTAFLDQTEPFPFDTWGSRWSRAAPVESYRPLHTSECREMLDSGWIEIGAHTHTHQDFRGKPAELREDLDLCVTSLDERFGIRSPTFAFPYGRVAWGYAGGELTEAARTTGVTCALTTECKANHQGSDPFHWGRFNVYDWDTSQTLEAKLAGWYSWAPHLQERLSRSRKRGF
jgi:peptidoglycan/xylan/chitin deacetylase (PgdA/CDA1 family)